MGHPFEKQLASFSCLLTSPGGGRSVEVSGDQNLSQVISGGKTLLECVEKLYKLFDGLVRRAVATVESCIALECYP